jgi:hypothetical protein
VSRPPLQQQDCRWQQHRGCQACAVMLLMTEVWLLLLLWMI